MDFMTHNSSIKMKSTRGSLLILILITVASRLFFLDAGCGAEEDAWGIRLAAKHFANTGEYEASRLPGHPLQEFVYAAIVNKTSILGMNSVTAFFSILACIFFFLILKELKCNHPFLGALAFAFTPIIYIHSTDCMDYIWALAFILMSYYSLLKERIVLAGIMLGMAIGCRITSGVMIIPFLLHLYYFKKDYLKNIGKLLIFTFMIAELIFIPVIQKYGWGFFHYYDQFPYPSFGKLIYKASIGVWGITGCLGLLVFLLDRLRNYKIMGAIFFAYREQMYVWITVPILYIGLYFMLPQKSAYLIPIVPFVIILADQYLTTIKYLIVVVMIVISSFLFGINLSDKTRGSEPSSWSTTRTIGGQEVSFDFLHGLVIDDYLKRKARMEFTKKVLEKTALLTDQSIIISGWWLNPILDELNEKKHDNVKYVYCIDTSEMQMYINKGFAIFYLPEMDSINDLRFRISACSYPE